MTKIKIPSIQKVEDYMEHGSHYAFYKMAFMSAHIPLYYGNIIQTAKRTVSIWDPYFNISEEDDDSRIFSYQTTGLKWRFLMNKCKRDNFKTCAASWETNIRHQVPYTHKSNTEIEFRNFNDDGVWSFHDRFLIIDGETKDCKVYLVGGSVSFHLRAIHATGICELEDEDDKKLVKDMFDLYWKNARKYGENYQIAMK